MNALLIAIGNSLRHDDGAARHAAILLRASCDAEVRIKTQLTPETAAEFAGRDHVVFLDADAAAAKVSLEAVRDVCSPASLTHTLGPREVVALARALYGFAGRAWLCRIPARDFSPTPGLSPRARSGAAEAARRLLRLLDQIAAHSPSAPPGDELIDSLKEDAGTQGPRKTV